MKIYGICGGSGSGKSTACLTFFDHRIPIIDADEVYHEITDRPSECLSELTAAFGTGILKSSGGLDRAKLRSIVFSNELTAGEKQKTLETLNHITHRHVLSEMRKKIGEYREDGANAVLVDAPLLFESGFDRECDGVIAVVADPAVRVRRICERDGITEEQANARIAAQIPDSELIRRCDFVIHNDGDLDALRKEVESVLEKL